MSPRPILTLLCGSPPSEIARAHGDYMKWFRDGMGPRVELVPWDLRAGTAQPGLGNFAGVLVTGSRASLAAPEPWMEVAIETIREAAETDVPLLGICFGHQLVGTAYGAPTLTIAERDEHGSVEVELNDAGKDDPLFRGLPSHFTAHQSHFDQVDAQAVAYSNGLRVLASTRRTPVQALAAGTSIRSVQFHPEFSTKIMAAYLDSHALPMSRAVESKASSGILQNWLDSWIL